MKKLTSLYLCIAYFSQQCNTFLFETCIFLCFKGVFKSNSPIWHKKRPFLAKKQLKNEKTPKKLDVFSSGAVRQTRTADLILTKDVLYHLSHNSTLTTSCILLYSHSVVKDNFKIFGYFYVDKSMIGNTFLKKIR